MMPRLTRASVTGAGLLALLLGVSPAGAQERRERPTDREGPELTIPVEEILRELQRLRRMVEEERAARTRAEEALARYGDQAGEPAEAEPDESSPRERDEEPDRERPEEGEREGSAGGETPGRIEVREGPAGREAPGQVEVLEARVGAARARLEAAEVRLDASRQRLDRVERQVASQTVSEAERLEGLVAVAESQAQRADAFAQLVEAEYHLNRVLRSSGDDDEEGEEEDDVVEDEHGIELDDVVDTADRVLDLIRRFGDDRGRDGDRPRVDQEESLEIEVEVDGRLDGAFDIADQVLDLIQGFRWERPVR